MATIDNGRRSLEVIDVHVGGDVHRIVLGGVRELPGATVLEKMQYLKTHGDGLRQLLLLEPRGGHPSLYADLVVEPTHPDADAGFIIMEIMGYPVISGTNTMSTAIALLESGRVPMADGPNRISLEAPGGLIDIVADCERGKVTRVRYQANSPSFVYASSQAIEVPGWGNVAFDLIWTGAFYPVVSANALGLGFAFAKDEEKSLVAFSQAFLSAVHELPRPIHPEFGDEGPLSFVVFAGNPTTEPAGGLVARTSCYVHPSEHLCRAPAGVPSTAVLAQLVHRGILKRGDSLRTRSIFESELKVTVEEVGVYYGRYAGIRATVEGSGFVIAKTQVVVDFDDPMTPRDGLETILSAAQD
ncbi:proline racemase family protein [Burkholderia cepacia]|uniref:proline racemase family protein n=1 Tax=Burkholderia cepacia TaxID=292 RepID=UPI000A82F7A3|nr:proline racemase family protein [Burkholderia cepacia]